MRSLRLPVFILAALGLLSWFDFAANAANREKTTARQTLLHDGIERGYVVRAPRMPARREGLVPLVLVLHGGGGNARNAESMTGFTEKAAREGFLVVYPEGTSRFGDTLLTWNAGHCCGHAMNKRVNDVGFINALIDKLIKDYPVDPKRVYATGMSNGGMMTHRLGIELSNRFAAIAPVVATVFGDEKRPAYPVSAIIINGMLDRSVPWQGGLPGGRAAKAWDGTPARPAPEQAAFWARANGCANAPEKLDRGPLIRWRYVCPDGRAVESYLVRDNGHAWPGGQAGSRRGDRPSASLKATDVIWEFFKAHAK